jgi:16S rRNA (adenine1518-N6/adenine1519-N6)-dimethyltransferase
MIPSKGAERSWLARHRVRPRKRIGQNFLVHPQVATRLVDAIALPEGVPVIDVGAGAAALTRALLDAGSRVWAVEIDPRLVGLLRERFADAIDQGRLHLICGSILELDLAGLPSHPSGPFHLVGNLPYAITTPIVLWTLERSRWFRGAAVLVQKEVADRIDASPGGRTYGSLTVWIAYHAAVQRLTNITPGSFWPVPSVESTLLALTFRRTPSVHVRDPHLLERVLSTTFGHRRKMLRASLGEAIGSRAVAIQLLEHAQIDPTRRPESLSLEEFAVLANTLGDAL